MLNSKQKKILEIAEEENGVTIDFGLDVYEHRSSVSRCLKSLSNNGILEKRTAPKISKYDNVWVLTEKGKHLL